MHAVAPFINLNRLKPAPTFNEPALTSEPESVDDHQ